MDSATSTRN